MLTSAAYAELNLTSIDIDYDNASIELEGNATDEKNPVGLSVTCGENQAAFMQTNVADGKFSFSVTLDSSFCDKDLGLVISQINEKPVTKGFKLISSTSVDKWILSVNNLSEDWKTKTAEYYNDVLKILIDDNDYYTDNSDDILELVAGFKETYATPADFAADINRAIIMKKINDGSDDIAKQLLSEEKAKTLFNINFEAPDNAYALFNSYKKDKSNSEVLNTSGSGFLSPKEVRLSLKEASFIACINSAKAEKIAEILKNYSEICEKISENFSNILKNCTEVEARAAVNKGYTKASAILSDIAAAENEQSKTEEKLESNKTPSKKGSTSYKGMTSVVSSENTEEKNQNSENAENNEKFDDLDGYLWASEAILKLSELGIINGVGENKFMPEKTVTREEFVKMAVVLMNLYDSHAECDFSDVGKFDWFYPYVASAYESGLVSGINETTFGTGYAITRQDLLTILYRAVSSKISPSEIKELTFTDTADIDAYAYDCVEAMYSLGVVNGFSDGSFKPKNNATRAEAAVIIYNVYKLLNK